MYSDMRPPHMAVMAMARWRDGQRANGEHIRFELRANELAANWLPKVGELGRNGAKGSWFFRQNRTIFQQIRILS
jgi:hypothetical protein